VETLEWLDTFSEQWDTRQGRERNQADELDLAARQIDAVYAAASALGLMGHRPPSRDSYDHALVLGGLIRACINRPSYAARLHREGVSFGRVTGLGGHRPFVGDEFDLAERAGLAGLREEYEALDAGMRRAFGMHSIVREWGETAATPGGTWGVRQYCLPDGTGVDVAAAPSSDPGSRRANTPDLYAWFANELAHLEPGQTVLAVTTPIYVPAQHAAAVRMLTLPYGVEVETVGHDLDSVPAELRQDFTPSKYLMEIRAAIRSQLALVREARTRG
jgi:hypothetical protein